MIRLWSIITLFLLSFPGLYNLSVFVDYQVDMEQYVERCENRDVPMMNCDGKCLLAKKIKQANEDDRPSSPSFLSELSNYIQSEIDEVNFASFSRDLVRHDYVFRPRGGSTDIFHPPLV